MKNLLIVLFVFIQINLVYSQAGSVASYQVISSTTGGLGNILSYSDRFGTSIDTIGDLNNDGITDIIVGIPLDDDGGANSGAVRILFMDTNSTVKSSAKISRSTSSFSGNGISNGDYFGRAVAGIGDINGDGIPDIAVSAEQDNDGGTYSGAIRIIMLDTNGTIKGFQKISKLYGYGSGGLPISSGGKFGVDIGLIGDIDNDNVNDIVVGGFWDNGGGTSKGSVYILRLYSNGKVKAYQKIQDGITNFNAPINNYDYFGVSVTGIGDFNNDGVNDIAVGAFEDDENGSNNGSVYLINLTNIGGVHSYSKISNATPGALLNQLPTNEEFGVDVSGMQDIDGNGINDLIVGAYQYGGSQYAAAYIVMIDTNGLAKSYYKIDQTKISNINSGDRFGFGVSRYKDINNNGNIEIIVGAPKDDDGGSDKGGIYIIDIRVALSVSTSSTPILCYGDSTATAIASGSGTNPPFTFLWSSGSTNDTISNLVAGTYTVTMTNSANVTATTSVTITEPTLLLVAASTDTSTCFGNSILISASASGGTGAKTLHWNNGLSSVNSHIIFPINNTIYSVYATDANNCTSATDDIQITVNPLPNVSFTGPTLNQCINDSIIPLIGIPIGGSFNGNGVSGTNFNPSVAGIGIHQIIYHYTDTNGCFGADSNFTLIHDIPTVYAGQDTLIPCGSQGIIIGESSQSLHTYLWSPYAGLNNPFISNPTANPWVNTTFVLKKTSLTTNCSNTDTVLIRLPSGLPSISIHGDTVICQGDSVHLIAQSNVIDSIFWDYGQEGSNFDHLITSSQFVHVEVIDSNLCISKDSTFITIHNLPQPLLGQDTNLFHVDTLVLNPGNFLSYLWSTGATTQSISIFGNTIGLGNHTFSVNVMDANACTNTDAITISIIDAIDGKGENYKIKVYPNPSSDWVYLDFNKATSINQILLFDGSGKLLESNVLNSEISNYKLKVSHLAKGKYYLQILMDGQKKTIPIFVQ